jgi:hypothetical protein
MNARPKVLILDSTVHPEGVAMLERQYEVTLLPPRAREEQVMEVSGGAVAFLVRTCTVSRRVIEATPGLRIIARHGSGVDSVDVAAATEHGVVVTITGAANSTAVAEFTFALLLGLCRLIAPADAGMRTGEWNREAFLGVELEGKTLGIIGLGNAGAPRRGEPPAGASQRDPGTPHRRADRGIAATDGDGGRPAEESLRTGRAADPSLGLAALNLVLEGAPGGGVTRTLALDPPARVGAFSSSRSRTICQPPQRREAGARRAPTFPG